MIAMAACAIALYALGVAGVVAHQAKRWHYMPDPPEIREFFDRAMIRHMTGTVLFRYTGAFVAFVGGAAALGGTAPTGGEMYAQAVAAFGLGFSADSSRGNATTGLSEAPVQTGE